MSKATALLGVSVLMVALSACGAGSDSDATSATSNSASASVDCAALLSAMQNNIVAISQVLRAGGSGTPVETVTAGEFQGIVDTMVQVMPPLPPDAQPYLDYSQQLADLLTVAAEEGLTYDDILPEFEGLVNDPGYEASSTAGEKAILPACPLPEASS